MRNRTFFILIFAVSVLCSCKEPLKEYSFVSLPTETGSSGEKVSFAIDMKELDVLYDIHISCRLKKDFPSQTVKFSVTIVSPSGKQFGENVSFPADIPKIKKYIKKNEDPGIMIISSHGSHDIEWCYRKNITPTEYGEWKMVLTLHDDGIEGVGVSCLTPKRKKHKKSEGEEFIDSKYKDSLYIQ